DVVPLRAAPARRRPAQTPPLEPARQPRLEDTAGGPLEVAAPRLLALDGLEQGLEVARPEPPRSLPLDDLEEERGPVGDGLGEDLEEVTVVVSVHQHSQAGQLVPG